MRALITLALLAAGLLVGLTADSGEGYLAAVVLFAIAMQVWRPARPDRH